VGSWKIVVQLPVVFLGSWQEKSGGKNAKRNKTYSWHIINTVLLITTVCQIWHPTPLEVFVVAFLESSQGIHSCQVRVVQVENDVTWFLQIKHSKFTSSTQSTLINFAFFHFWVPQHLQCISACTAKTSYHGITRWRTKCSRQASELRTFAVGEVLRRLSKDSATRGVAHCKIDLDKPV